MRSTWVKLRFPPQFRLGLDVVAERCGWHVRAAPGDASICLEEHYSRVEATLFRATRLVHATEASVADRYAGLARIDEQSAAVGLSGTSMDVSMVREVADPAGPEDLWVAFRLQFTALPPAELPAFAQREFTRIAEAAPAAVLWQVTYDSRLIWRLATARALFAAAANPAALDLPEDGRLRLFPGSTAFLRSQMLGFATYLEPLLLALSPWMIGLPATRHTGALVVLFDEAAPGLHAAQAAEILQVFRPLSFPSARPTLARPTTTRENHEAALRWWVDRLNALFAMALDVSRYRDADGYFEPSGQIGVLLSLERLFASVQEVLVHVRRDEFARAAMFFDVLDVLDGLGYDSWEGMVTLHRVEGHLGWLRTVLPPHAQAVLLPRCETAVAALREVTQGFSDAASPDGKILLPTKSGRLEPLGLDRAAAELLHLTRNAAHSYRERVRDERDVALLAAHRADLPETLSDLAWIHLLRFLADPRLPVTGD
jgi:hypothetical protein